MPDCAKWRSTREKRVDTGGGKTLRQLRANVRKLLPSLAIGICLTLLAAVFNYLIYQRRLPALAAGNRVFGAARRDRGERGDRGARPLAGFLRSLAGLVNLADDVTSDLMFRLRGPGVFPSTRDRIALVAIDEASVMRRGSWPWSRRDVAAILDKVADARVVGLGLIFAEPDRTSLVNYIPPFHRLYGIKLDPDRIDPEIMNNDLLLAKQIARTRTVLGAVLHSSDMSTSAAPDRLIANYSLKVATMSGQAIPASEVLLKRSSRIMADLPVIRRNKPPPSGEGFLNLFPSPNGVVKDIPLFAHVSNDAFASPTDKDRRVCPSLAIEMMRIFLGGDGYRLNLRGDIVNIPEFGNGGDTGDRYAVKNVCITRSGPSEDETLLEIPLNELGEMEVGFRGRRRDYEIYPAWEVLEGKHDGAFKDKLVVVGGSLATVGPVVSTGLPDFDISVAEAHAFMLSAMLKRDFMDSDYEDDYAWQQGAILISGLAVTLALIFGNLGIGMLVSGLTILGILFGNYYLLFRRGLDVGMTLPLLSTLAVLVVQMVTNYLLVGRERRFIRKAFSLNVSPSILGYLETHPDRLSSLSGEHRDMTVLFTDIRGFTAISERMTPPDLARFLNEYFTPMSDVVMKNMGTVDKFIGDALMAFWNAPADNPRHARDAARSALAMLARLAGLQTGWTARGLPKVAIGCGINTGPMFAGYMGSEQRKNYTVMGDNVNIASRLEELNKVYSTSVLITESTLRELSGEFVCRVVDKVRVSGKMSSVVIYELLGEGPGGDEESEEIAAFERVFELYQHREFATAETLLKELVFIRPRPLYKMYLDRLAIYKALPPPPDWDGTFAMRQK